jgi:hypothetical protein
MPLRTTRPTGTPAMVAALVIALAGAACSPGAGRSSCSNGRCTVTATGEANIQLSDLDATLEVRSIGAGEAAVEVGDQRATIASGDTATVGELSVKVLSVSDGEAEFEVTRAGR